MADKQVKDLNDLGASCAVGDKLLIYDLSTTEDKRIDLDDLIAEIFRLHGVTSSAAELNKLDGTDAVVADFNKLHDITSSAAELNVLDTFTGDVHDLEYAKELKDTGVTDTEYGWLDGVVNQVMDVDKGCGASKASYTPSASSSTILTKGGIHAFDTTAGIATAVLPAIRSGYAQMIIIQLDTDGGDLTIIDNAADSGFVESDGSTVGTIVTLDNAGEYVMFISCGLVGGTWMIVGGKSFTLSG